MVKYEEVPGTGRTHADRRKARESYNEMMDSGKVIHGVTVAVLRPEAGDDPEALRLAVVVEGCTPDEAVKTLRQGAEALGDAVNPPAPAEVAEKMAEQAERHGTMAAGWLEFCAATNAHELPAPLYLIVRQSFYAGCAHLFAELADCPDPRTAPGEVNRMVNAMGAELEEFVAEMAMSKPGASNARH